MCGKVEPLIFNYFEPRGNKSWLTNCMLQVYQNCNVDIRIGQIVKLITFDLKQVPHPINIFMIVRSFLIRVFQIWMYGEKLGNKQKIFQRMFCAKSVENHIYVLLHICQNLEFGTLFYFGYFTYWSIDNEWYGTLVPRPGVKTFFLYKKNFLIKIQIPIPITYDEFWNDWNIYSRRSTEIVSQSFST